MNIVKHFNRDDYPSYFSVRNRDVSRWYMYSVVSKISGVEVIKRPRFWDDDVFCEFKYRNFNFHIEEPYGDSDTFDVVVENNGKGALSEIADYFESVPSKKRGDFLVSAFFLVRHLAMTILVLYLAFVLIGFFS